MILYLPANGTAGLARSLERMLKRSPVPPARITASNRCITLPNQLSVTPDKAHVLPYKIITANRTEPGSFLISCLPFCSELCIEDCVIMLYITPCRCQLSVAEIFNDVIPILSGASPLLPPLDSGLRQNDRIGVLDSHWSLPCTPIQGGNDDKTSLNTISGLATVGFYLTMEI